jgi:hypothetical protein
MVRRKWYCQCFFLDGNRWRRLHSADFWFASCTRSGDVWQSVYRSSSSWHFDLYQQISAAGVALTTPLSPSTKLW